MVPGCIQTQACKYRRYPGDVATQDPQHGTTLDVWSKHVRVANFHATTLKTCFEMVAAMGLDDPGLLEPRISGNGLAVIPGEPRMGSIPFCKRMSYCMTIATMYTKEND